MSNIHSQAQQAQSQAQQAQPQGTPFAYGIPYSYPYTTFPGSFQSGYMGMRGFTPGAGSIPPQVPSGTTIQGPPQTGSNIGNVPGQLPLQQSFIENILRLNLGKRAVLHMTYENNKEWNAKIFRGVLEAAGRDHIIISEPETGKRYLLLMVNLDYITFDEPLNYTYPFHPGGTPSGR